MFDRVLNMTLSFVGIRPLKKGNDFYQFNKDNFFSRPLNTDQRIVKNMLKTPKKSTTKNSF